MQIYIIRNKSYWQPSESVYTEFDGKMLRTYYNGQITNTRKASIGECFNVIPRDNKKPLVEKEILPKTRGRKIAWCLSFESPQQYAQSLADFIERSNWYSADCRALSLTFADNGSYAFMFSIQKEPLLKNEKPTLAYISDTISKEEIEELISDYRKHYSLKCPSAFLRIL